jgi:hypothetical protein
MNKSTAVTMATTARALAPQSFVAKSAFAMAKPSNRFDYVIAGNSLVLAKEAQGHR